MQNFPKAERAERTQPRAGIRPIGYAGYYPPHLCCHPGRLSFSSGSAKRTLCAMVHSVTLHIVPWHTSGYEFRLAIP